MAFRRCLDSLAGQFGRRRFLIGALASGVTLARAPRLLAASEFWNAKDPSTWTDDEILMLTSKSPWARLAALEFKGADDPTEASNGGPAVGGRGRGPSRRAAETILVRWESAQPILDGLRAPLPADFDGHYVLSVTNLPGAYAPKRGRGGETPPDDALDRLQNGATLDAKGKDPVEAGIARRTRTGSILFGFAKDYLRLTPSDRDIVFTLETGQLKIKAKFDGKDMSYHGKMAV
ncbi:MAG TPA: hypothetical protein VK789_13725 [Bryobacteraceae bacterium]|jgi:hypothetical protein|nr:hypothetical protein [Bryobacteraceae bacterium]